MSEPTPKDISDASLTKAGYWDGFTLKTGVTQRGREAGSAPDPTPEPPPPGGTGVFDRKMKYGVSGTNGGWPSAYMAQVAALHVNNGLFYGQDPRWSQIAGPDGTGIPDHHDIWLQTKATTRAAYDATIASLPDTRTGKVLMFYWNEPEGQIRDGVFTMAQWQARQDALFAAIDAAPASKRAYLVKGLCVQFYDLRQHLKGNNGTNNMFNMPMYMRPGTQMVHFSAYSDIGTTTTGTQIKNWLSANYPGVGYDIVTGWQLVVGSATYNSVTERQARANWMQSYAGALKTQGCQRFQWFDMLFVGQTTTQDYRIEVPPGNDQILEDAWVEMLQADGSW